MRYISGINSHLHFFFFPNFPVPRMFFGGVGVWEMDMDMMLRVVMWLSRRGGGWEVDEPFPPPFRPYEKKLQMFQAGRFRIEGFGMDGSCLKAAARRKAEREGGQENWFYELM